MKNRLRVFIPEPEWEDSHIVLEEVAEVRVGLPGIEYDEARLKREVKDVDGLIITSQHHVTDSVIGAGSRLRVIGKYGSKPKEDNVDLRSATKNGIIVCYTPGANADSVAEYAIALMLNLIKRVHINFPQLRSGQWRDLSLLGEELLDKTVGIIGLGIIGCKVAKKIQAFQVNLLAYDPYVSKKVERKANVTLVSLDSLLRRSDIVTVHTALTEETRGLIGESELRLLKRNAIIVNTARGPIIDEKALARALNEGWILGAGLDTFAEEPPGVDNPLLKMSNALVTPHFASCTKEAYQRETYTVAQDVSAVLKGNKPHLGHVANPEVLSMRRLISDN
jgi:D-3-phosphoglycerate dehydrogenase